MEKDRIIYLIKRVRAKVATDEEKQELHSLWQWAGTDTRLFDVLSDAEKESIRRTMLANIGERLDEIENDTSRWRMLVSPSLFLKIAASISVIAVLSFFVYGLSKDDRIEHNSAFGEKIQIVLPDQTKVVINGNSRLRHAEIWADGDDREVWLEGEGFFDVTHTGQRFIVHIEDDKDVHVLGTRFNVKERRGKTEVMLEQGKVMLTVDRFLSSQSVTLKPGELATLADRQLTTQIVDPARYSSWKENKFIFDRTPLTEIATMLEDTYGYVVVFEDRATGNRTLSGEVFSKNGSDIVDAISQSFGIQITVDKNRIVIHSASD